jgi:hypothetical protein
VVEVLIFIDTLLQFSKNSVAFVSNRANESMEPYFMIM